MGTSKCLFETYEYKSSKQALSACLKFQQVLGQAIPVYTSHPAVIGVLLSQHSQNNVADSYQLCQLENG